MKDWTQFSFIQSRTDEYLAEWAPLSAILAARNMSKKSMLILNDKQGRKITLT